MTAVLEQVGSTLAVMERFVAARTGEHKMMRSIPFGDELGLYFGNSPIAWRRAGGRILTTPTCLMSSWMLKLGGDVRITNKLPNPEIIGYTTLDPAGYKVLS